MAKAVAAYTLSALSGMFFISGLAILIGGRGDNYGRSGELSTNDRLHVRQSA